MTEEQIKHMANRFLMWKLPANFNPDNGISYAPAPYAQPGAVNYEAHRPSGTNLWGWDDAVAMVRHMAEGMPE